MVGFVNLKLKYFVIWKKSTEFSTEIRPDCRRLFWGQQPQKWRLLPELALVGRLKTETESGYSFKSIVETWTANVNMNGVGTWDNNSLFIQISLALVGR